MFQQSQLLVEEEAKNVVEKKELLERIHVE
jgi:hypothetical protein